MFLNQIIRTIRTKEKIPKTKTYKNTMSKSLYEHFEKGNEKSIKVAHVGIIAQNLNIPTQDLLHYSKASFKNEEEIYYDKVVEMVNQFVQTNKKEKKESLKKEINEHFKVSVKTRFDSCCMFSLYIFLKSISSNINLEISPPDQTDLIDIKKIIKSKTFYTSFEYKILSNLAIYFSFNDLKEIIEILYPLESNMPLGLIEASYISIENLLLTELRQEDLTNCFALMEILDKNLELYPSYQHRLIYLQFKELLEYLINLEPKHLFQCWNYIEIMSIADPNVNLKQQKEALYKIIEHRTGKEPNIGGFLNVTKNNGSSLENTANEIIDIKGV
ncbi:hypothetical protein IGK74_002281 [Enterococcus sp. AZ150]|uniref:hypothetical protein n=1 Tax=Enterococcus sp. AZ150 TaxID=2774866 RepID=UPI003F2488FC